MRIKATLRQLRLALGKQLFDRFSPPQPLDFPPKSILFLRHDGKIGDYVVSSFVFREIKKHSPNTKIGVVCSHKNAYLFKQNPYIDQLYFVKTKSILDYLKCAKQLAKENYELVIDPTVTLRNRDLLFLRTIKAQNYLGYQKEHYRLFNLNLKKAEDHFSDIYRKALELVGFTQIDTQYDVPFNEQAEQEIQAFLKENQLNNYIAVNFFGAGSARRFSAEKMRNLLDSLTSKTMNIVLLGVPDEMDKLIEFNKAYKNVFLYQKPTTIFHTISLIKHCDLLISPDTSTVHIATGLNKKLIAFYSDDKENFIHWHPNNQNETHILRFEKSVNELDFSMIQDDWLK